MSLLSACFVWVEESSDEFICALGFRRRRRVIVSFLVSLLIPVGTSGGNHPHITLDKACESSTNPRSHSVCEKRIFCVCVCVTGGRAGDYPRENKEYISFSVDGVRFSGKRRASAPNKGSGVINDILHYEPGTSRAQTVSLRARRQNVSSFANKGSLENAK